MEVYKSAGIKNLCTFLLYKMIFEKLDNIPTPQDRNAAKKRWIVSGSSVVIIYLSHHF